MNINNYHKNGWVKIKNFIKSHQVIEFKKKINIFLEKKYHKYDDRFINFVNDEKKIENINSFHKLDDCKWIKNFSQNKKLKNIVKKLLKTNSFKLRQAEYFAKPKKKGLAAPDHQDNYFWNLDDSNAITVWIALTESNKKNGGVYYFNSSHNYGILKHKKSYMKGTSQTIKDKKFLKKFSISYPSLKKGDALVHHSLIVHGSKQNKSIYSRKGITFQYIKKNAKIDLKKKIKYEKKLFEQIRTR
tara:strand:- start:258 stop:989 length:732 start_codon:yes stop_codon:yes gene_type:complete